MHLFETAAEWINLSEESWSETEMQEKHNFPSIAAARSCFWGTGAIYGAHLQSPAHRHIHHRSRIQHGTPRRVWSLLPIWTPLLHLMDTVCIIHSCHSNPFLLFQISVKSTSQTTLHSTIKIQSNYTIAEKNITRGLLNGTYKGRNNVFF